MNTQTKRTIFRALIGLALMSSGPILASELPLFSDVAYFRAGSGKTRVEVYLAFDRAGLTYKKTRRGRATELATVVVVRQKRQMIDYQEFTIKDVRPKEEAPSGNIVRQASFTLAPGSYAMDIVAEDKSGNRAEREIEIEVPMFKGPYVDISSGQLASLIRRTMGPREFLKQGLYVVPNARLQFAQGNDLLWYYAETYGLTPVDTVTITTEVYHGDSLVAAREPKTTPSPSHTLVHWGAWNPEQLPAGENILRIRVIAAGDTVQTEKAFTTAAGDTAVTDTAATETADILSTLGETGMASLAVGLSLVTDLNMRQYRAGDITTKQQMIRDAVDQLVEQRGGDTTDAIGELYRNWEIAKSYDRYQLTRRRLSAQGRILFLYGRPDVIETYPATNTHREYQVWEYTDGDSVLQAIFLDREGFGEFTLEHATLPGRKQNPNWLDQLPRGAEPEALAPAPVAVEVEEEPIPAVEAAEQVEPETVPPGDVPPTEPVEESIVTEPAFPDTLPTVAPSDTLVTEPAVEDTLQTP